MWGHFGIKSSDQLRNPSAILECVVFVTTASVSPISCIPKALSFNIMLIKIPKEMLRPQS